MTLNSKLFRIFAPRIMDATDHLKIDLRALPLGTAQLDAVLDDEFFASLQQDEVHQGSVRAAITLHRTSQETFDVECRLNGEVKVPCTMCMEPMSQPIDTTDTLKVRFGESDLDDGNAITVQWSRGVLDLSWPLYEIVALSIPIRHVHTECDTPEQTED